MRNKVLNIHDGSSQSDREIAELQADHFAIDEQKIDDFISFVQHYAAKLNFIDVNNENDGNWSTFFSAEGISNKEFASELVEFANDPAKFIHNSNKVEQFTEPHLVLLLIFLDLYRYPQKQLNNLLENHLDFYYNEVLKIKNKQDELVDSSTGKEIVSENEIENNTFSYENIVADAVDVSSVKIVTTKNIVSNIPEKKQFYKKQCCITDKNGLEVTYSGSNVDAPRLVVIRHNEGSIKFSVISNTLIIKLPFLQQCTARAVVDAWHAYEAQDLSLTNQYFQLKAINNGLAIVKEKLYFVDSYSFQIISTNNAEQGITIELIRKYIIVNIPHNIPTTTAQLRTKLLSELYFLSEEQVSQVLALNQSSDDDFTVGMDYKFSTTIQYGDYSNSAYIRYCGNSASTPEFHQLLVSGNSNNAIQALGFFDNKLLAFYKQQFTRQQFLTALSAMNFSLYLNPSASAEPAEMLVSSTGEATQMKLQSGANSISGYSYLTAQSGLHIKYYSENELPVRPEFSILTVSEFNNISVVNQQQQSLIESFSKVGFVLQGNNLIVLLKDNGVEPVTCRDVIEAWKNHNFSYVISPETNMSVGFNYSNNDEWLFENKVILKKSNLVVKYLSDDREAVSYLSVLLNDDNNVGFNVDVDGMTINLERNNFLTPNEIVSLWDQQDNYKNKYNVALYNEKLVGSGMKNKFLFDNKAAYDKRDNIQFPDNGVMLFSNNNVDAAMSNKMGFAITSPLFLAKEGERTINVDINCNKDSLNFSELQELLSDTLPDDVIQDNEVESSETIFKVYVSSSKEWISPDKIKISYRQDDTNMTLAFVLIFNDDNHAISKLAKNDGQSAYAIENPSMKILLDNDFIYYKFFDNIIVNNIKIKLTVKGLSNIKLRNDDIVYTGNKNVNPFGDEPNIGSSLYFANEELCRKNVDSLTLNFDWKKLPADFSQHYENYILPEGTIINNYAFQAGLYLIDNNIAQHSVNGKISLFANDNLQYITYNMHHNEYPEMDIENSDPLEWPCYYKLKLETQDFLHNRYEASLGFVSQVNANNVNGASYHVRINAPYTPLTDTVTIDYVASAEIILTESNNVESAHTFFQLQPFGYKKLSSAMSVDELTLLPSYIDEQYLYVGIANGKPQQTIQLSFDIYSEHENVISAPKIEWQYLSDDYWKSVKNYQILSDTTYGLTDTGAIIFNLPADISNNNHLMQSGLYWLRASQIKQQSGKTFLINVSSEKQVVVPGNDNHGAILSGTDNESSKLASNNSLYRTRVSERLRHKQRALTVWDYEHLILEQFPQLSKVKCIANYMSNVVEQYVTLMVIPDLTKGSYQSSLTPKVSTRLLHTIKSYVDQHAPLGVVVNVKNPRYQTLNYNVDVVFTEGYDQGYYAKKLNDALVNYLTPWSTQQTDINFASSIYNTEVASFLEHLPYVDYVTNITLTQEMHELDNQGNIVDVYYKIQHSGKAEVQFEDTILVSSTEHNIKILNES